MLLPKTPFSEANHFGISIADTSVKVMRVNPTGEIVNQAESTFEDSIIQGENINQDILLNGLKQVVDQAGINQKYAAVVIPEKFAYSRAHTFPSLNTHEIDEAIKWQIEKIFPFTLKEVYIDWKLIAQTDKATDVIITVIPKNLLDQLKAILQAAGIFPIGFEPSTSALTRLLSQEVPKDTIIMEIYESSMSASLVINNVSILTTTATFPSGQPEQVMSQYAAGLIHSLKVHLQKIENPPQDLQVFITGEQASSELAQSLTQALGLTTQVLQIDAVEPKDHLVFIAANATILPPQSEKSINLLPTNLQLYYKAHIDYTLSKSVAKYVIALAVIGILISGFTFMGVMYSKSSVQKQLKLAQNNAPTVGSSEFNLAEVNKKSQRIIELFPKKTSPEQYLTALFNTVPQDVEIQYVTYTQDSQTFQLVGVVPNRDSLLGLRDTIARAEIFTAPDLPLAALENFENQQFSLEFTIKKQDE